MGHFIDKTTLHQEKSHLEKLLETSI